MTDRHQLTPTPVRIPSDIKAQLQAEAKANDRSLNGEIVARLRSTLKGKRSTTSTPQKEPQQ